jgi:hypothetical protein
MVGTQVVWDSLSRNGGSEHPAEGDTIDIPCMYTKANDAPRELVVWCKYSNELYDIVIKQYYG